MWAGRRPALARAGCALSLILSVLIVAVDRWIAFSIQD